MDNIENDETQFGPVTPPPVPGSTPPPFDGEERAKSRRKFKRATWVAAFTVGLIVLLLALLIIKGVRHQSSGIKARTEAIKPHVERDTDANGNVTTIVTYGNTSGNTADAQTMEQMEREMQEQMAQMDSMMNAMMASPFGGDPFADGQEQPVPHQQAKRPAAGVHNGIARLAGNVGNLPVVMVLNVKDPQNVRGTSSFVQGGKASTQLNLLGIMDATGLTVTLYKKGSKTPLGTLSGEFDGQTYSGTYVAGNKQEQFTLVTE